MDQEDEDKITKLFFEIHLRRGRELGITLIKSNDFLFTSVKVLQKSLPGVPDGQKNVWVRLCAEGFRPAAVKMTAGAGTQESAVVTNNGIGYRASGLSPK